MSQIKYLDESGLNVYDHEIKKYIKDKSHVVLPFKISKNTNDSTLLNVSCSGLKSKKIQNILETIYNNPNSFILLNLDIENKGLVKVVGSVNIIDSATIQVTGSFNYDTDHITVDVKFKRIENSWEIIEQVGLISACPKLDDSTGKIAEEYMPEKIDMAKDLTGVIEATPEEFNFRPSAGDKSIRDESAVIRSIKGNSLVWNQNIKTALSQADYGANGWWNRQGSDKITIDGRKVSYTVVKNAGYGNQISQKVPIKKGHKYLIHFWYDTHGVINDDYGRAIRVLLSNNVYGEKVQKFLTNQNAITSDIINLFITADSDYEYYILSEPYVTDNIVEHIVDFADVQLIDLTKMFGSGNEPSTIEEFYTCIPQNIDIFAYNEGQIINNNTNSIKTVGFNQWDEEWELGYLNSDGTSAPNYVQNYIRAKNYIPVIAGKKYFAKLPEGVRDCQLYSVDKNFKLVKQIYPWDNSIFTIPEGASYIRFYLNYGGEVYNNDICINLSDESKNGTYEPYRSTTKDLSFINKYFPNGMCKAGSVYDEISWDNYNEKWKAIQRVGVVDLGSLNWTLSNDTIFKSTKSLPITDLKKPLGNEIIGTCARYVYVGQTALSTTPDSISIFQSGRLWINDGHYTDAASLKESLQGVMLYYELAEPIETPLEEPIQLDYVVEDWGTEEAISDEPSAPFKADIVYQFNAEGRIRDNSRNIEILENTTVKSIPQSLSEDQKKQVRENIGAASINDSKRLFKYHRAPMTEDDGSGLVYLEETEEDRINNIEILNWIFSNGFENADPSGLGLGVVAIATQDDSTEMITLYLAPFQMSCSESEDGDLYYVLYSGNYFGEGVGTHLVCAYSKHVNEEWKISMDIGLAQMEFVPINPETGKIEEDYLPEYDVEVNPTLKFIVDENQQTGDPSVAALSEGNYVEHNRKVLNYIKDNKDKALHVVIDINPKGDSNIVSIQCTWAFDSPTDDLILFGETIMGYTRIILSGFYHNFSTDPVLGCSIMLDEMNYVKYNENGKIDFNYLPEYDVEINPTLKFIADENQQTDDPYVIPLSEGNYVEHNRKVLNYITDHQNIGVKMAIYNYDNGRPMYISSCMLNIDNYGANKKNYNITGSTVVHEAIYILQCTYEKVDNIYTFNQSASDFQYYLVPALDFNTGKVYSDFIPTNKLYFTMNTTDNTVSQNTQYSDSNAQMISDIYSKQSSLSDIEVNAVLESTSSDVLYKLCLSNITKNENGMNLTFTSGNYIALLVELLNNESNDGFEFGNINISNNNPLWEIK